MKHVLKRKWQQCTLGSARRPFPRGPPAWILRGALTLCLGPPGNGAAKIQPAVTTSTKHQFGNVIVSGCLFQVGSKGNQKENYAFGGEPTPYFEPFPFGCVHRDWSRIILSLCGL